MDEQELLKERFKSAVSSAVKAISENFNLEIKFGNKTTTKKDSLNLPEIVKLKKLQDFTNLRAFADSEALKIKYTNEKIYLKNEPRGSMAKSLYAIAEKIRYEKIGANKLKGIKNNITQCYENRFKDKKIDEIMTEADVPITEAFELYLRKHFFEVKQNEKTEKILSYWKDLFDNNLKRKLNALDNCLENQNEFGKLIVDLINKLEFQDSNEKEKKETKDTKKEDFPESENDNDENNLTQDENEVTENSGLNLTESNLESFKESYFQSIES